MIIVHITRHNYFFKSKKKAFFECHRWDVLILRFFELFFEKFVQNVCIDNLTEDFINHESFFDLLFHMIFNRFILFSFWLFIERDNINVDDMCVMITRCEMIISTIYCVSRLVYMRYETSTSKAGRYESFSTIKFF